MVKKEFITKNAKETEKLGGMLARKVIHMQGPTLHGMKKAMVLGLEGELGAGKTTFVKGFANGLGIKENITSPTFVLIKNHELGQSANDRKVLVHIDAYRLKDHQGLIPLGIKEILDNPENMVLVEWSDRVEKILPKKYLKIHIDHIDNKTRKVTYV